MFRNFRCCNIQQEAECQVIVSLVYCDAEDVMGAWPRVTILGGDNVRDVAMSCRVVLTVTRPQCASFY